jgi:hypothetical protein
MGSGERVRDVLTTLECIFLAPALSSAGVFAVFFWRVAEAAAAAERPPKPERRVRRRAEENRVAGGFALRRPRC